LKKSQVLKQSDKSKFSKLPGVDTILANESMQSLLQQHQRELVVYYTREILNELRQSVSQGSLAISLDEIISRIKYKVDLINTKSLKPVINATGVIVHTNLGRAPFGKALLEDANEVLTGYNNLEFDLDNASRGSRYTHVTDILKYLTGAEDVLVVNNNAAAIMLVLRAFAKGREVVVSRGELIEIGGSFRMPDIMKASDCKMIEVGTTNKTHAADFENAINSDTAMLLKVHTSNYIIKGFTKEATLQELVKLGKQNKLPVVYDMGSGLLRKPSVGILKDEPDVMTTLATGIDLVTFSGDKLLGGPQAGIIAGKAHLIAKLKKEPMTRALRVGKETLALLGSLCVSYLDEKKLSSISPIYRMMRSTIENLTLKAEKLKSILLHTGLKIELVKSFGQTGGGSLPDETIDSIAVQLSLEEGTRKEKTEFAEKVFYSLLKGDKPLLGVLRKGNLIFDVLTLDEEQINESAELIMDACREAMKDE
jgi:L-seryl-tRNA(Ser) seleniumtransferase